MHIPSDFPVDLAKRLQNQYKPVDYQTLLSEFSKPRMTSFRINTLKSTQPAVEAQLAANNIPYEKIGWMPGAYQTPLPARRLSSLPIYQLGHIYVQNLSSMIPVLILDPKPFESVLDLTAAPGSKTTQMAMMMQNCGEVVANDTSSIRLRKLKANLSVQSVKNTRTTKIPGQAFWKSYPEYFDKVLLDAPCSLEGRIRFALAKSYLHWTNKKVKELKHLQKWLIRSAFSCVKVGGVLVYSTCTLSEEENEEIIAWLLLKERTRLFLNDIKRDYPHLPWWKKQINYRKHYNSEISKTARVFPNQEREGFFIASVQKTATNVINLY
jgi:16S rRNA (cytosine1407-C5)-methyltransferase